MTETFDVSIQEVNTKAHGRLRVRVLVSEDDIATTSVLQPETMSVQDYEGTLDSVSIGAYDQEADDHYLMALKHVHTYLGVD